MLIRTKMKLSSSLSIFQNVQPDCLQTGDHQIYKQNGLYKVQDTSKCIKDLFGRFSTCTISQKSLIRRSRPLIHFFLHDNPSKFTCSQNMLAICALKVQPPNVRSLKVCFFRQKLSDIAYSDSARATFSRQ